MADPRVSRFRIWGDLNAVPVLSRIRINQEFEEFTKRLQERCGFIDLVLKIGYVNGDDQRVGRFVFKADLGVDFGRFFAISDGVEIENIIHDIIYQLESQINKKLEKPIIKRSGELLRLTEKIKSESIKSEEKAKEAFA